MPRVIGPCQRSHRRRAYAVAAHVHLLSRGERLAVGTVADDVVSREALCLVQFGRPKLAKADVLGRTFQHHCDSGLKSMIVMVPLRP